MRDRFIATLCEIAERDARIMLITADLGFGVLDEYRKRFPDRFINAGVAEQSMTMIATGLALEGRIVFTYSIANFPTLRCLEMIRNDAAYHNANIKIVAVGGGFSYGALGMSHHATEDLAIMRSLPSVSTFAPGSLTEVEAVTKAMVEIEGTCYLRLDKDVGAEGSVNEPVSIGRPRLVRKGHAIAIFSTGGILSEVMAAAELMKRCNLDPSVYSVHSHKPIDRQAIVDAAAAHRLLVTVEEHTTQGGLSSLILEILADAQALPSRLLRIGIEDIFPDVVGSQQYLRSINALDATSIARRISDAVR